MKLKKKNNKKVFYILLLIFVLSSMFYRYLDNPSFKSETGILYSAKVEGKSYMVYENGQFKEKFLKGVNIGAGKPGHFPGELEISEEDYYRWFHYISDMNADVIRVYTTMNPAFYNALYRFNLKNDNPLYVFHGVWVREEDITELANGHDEKIKNTFINDGKRIVDVIHGDAVLPESRGVASGIYTKDISRYVIGWILGIEWYPDFIVGTNEKNPNITGYKGEYIYTETAPAFESFLAEVGDNIISYETKVYKTQRPLAFSSWPTADTLVHPNEPSDVEDWATFNSELIKSTKKFEAGLFASYHIYPYYPDFINYSKKFRKFKDDNGDINTYKAYIRTLKATHTVPVIISEFGVPASRGKAHDEIYRGFNQGEHDESEQGNMNVSLLNDIYDEGYSGAFVFIWQDEWFKRTWNTMDYDVQDRRPYWSNAQTNEQQFGLLAFDPGEKESTVYVDGDVSDWDIISEKEFDVQTKSDEKYLYLRVYKKDFNPNEDKIFIPIDTIDGQGNTAADKFNFEFEKPIEFLVNIDGENKSKVLVDAYYDTFYYTYAKDLNIIKDVPKFEVKNSGIFNDILLCLNRPLFLPEEFVYVPISTYNTGILKFGNANPKSESFNSLVDFSYSGDNIEIRLPWALLNVSDPSTLQVLDDFYLTDGINHKTIKNINIGLIIKNNDRLLTLPMKEYSWPEWEEPVYHERLKPSYFIMKDAFEKLE